MVRGWIFLPVFVRINLQVRCDFLWKSWGVGGGCRAAGLLMESSPERIVCEEAEIFCNTVWEGSINPCLLIRQANSGIFFPPFPAKSARKDGAPSRVIAFEPSKGTGFSPYIDTRSGNGL